MITSMQAAQSMLADDRPGEAKTAKHEVQVPGLASTPKLEQLSKPHLRGCAKDFGKLFFLLKSDLYRYEGRTNFACFLRHFLFTPGYKVTVVFRTCGYFKAKRWSRHTLYYPLKFLLLRLRYKYGITIPEYTVIGPGLFINRFGGIYVNGDAVFGENVNLLHGVRVGQTNRGDRIGSPIIGDRVLLGMGCAVIGHIRVGDGAVVGVNAVVTRDVPENGVVGGIPAKLISNEGSVHYINRLCETGSRTGIEPVSTGRSS